MKTINNYNIDYSIVVPVYNSQSSLWELCNRIQKVFEGKRAVYEIILVDDSSKDDSWRLMQKLHCEFDFIRIFQHTRNFGQHKAILCGMEQSFGKYVITIDDDLQHPPEEIPKLIDALKEDDNCDVVIGAYEVKHHSLIRNVGTNTINALTSHIFGKDAGLKLTSFRIISRPVVNELLKLHYHNPRIGNLILLITNKIKNVNVEHSPRKHGESGYSLRRLCSDALDNILSNSSLPLQIVSYFGFATSLLSGILSIYYLFKYLYVGISVQGWTSVILILLFFFGVILFSLGMIGEYLIRILLEVQGNSKSIIRK